MFATKISTRTTAGLPKLAATAVICLSFGTNTHVNAANTFSTASIDPAIHQTQLPIGASPSSAPNDVQVLTSKDEALYRSIFAAQAKNNWVDADRGIANLTDKRLLGHVLADRYMRRPASAIELQAWLLSYTSLPEANDLYDQAQHLPATKRIKIAKPASNDAWTGSDSYGASFGFKADLSDNGTKDGRRFATKINHALRHEDASSANDLLIAEQERRDIPDEEYDEIQSQIAAGFFFEGQIEQARHLARQASASQNPLALWIGGLSAWKQNDIAEAAQFFAKLATQSGLSSWDRAAADYWAYRALKRNGDVPQANYWLKQAANQPRSFYGFLATQLLGHDAAWAWQLPTLNTKNVAALSGRPAGWRALALLQIGQSSLAESELRHLNPQGQHNLQEAMLALAEKMHMPSLAMQLGGIATNDNGKPYDAALYPVPPWQPEQGFQIDRALLYALMRHESQFDPTAVSGRGACGLMQLMPTTAHLVANDNKSDDECSPRLLDPSYNMALGQKYVRHLASQPVIGDNLLLLLAAYNSGPNKVARWIDDETRRDPLLFIESLPVRETRDYVQQVMIHYWTYRARLAEPETSLTQLANGQWPRYSLRDESNAPRTKTATASDFELASNMSAQGR